MISATILILAAIPAVVMAAAPVIATGGVVDAASYQPVIASGTWITIQGSNLSSSTRSWQSSDFNGANLPTMLDGVSVTINGHAAYVDYISPVQINALVPDDSTTGFVPVQVINAQGTSNTVTVNKGVVAPAFFAYSQAGGRYAVAQDAATNSLIAPAGLLGSSVSTVSAVPGQILTLYATGLGPVTSAQSIGQLVSAPATLTNTVTVTIGGAAATVQYAGLIGSGLYQINLVVPTTPSGDALLVLSVGGAQSAPKYLPVQAGNCVSGSVDYLTWSLQYLYLNLPDEVSIGQTKLCASCDIKPPVFQEMVKTLEGALKSRNSVQACYDENGYVSQLRARHP